MIEIRRGTDHVDEELLGRALEVTPENLSVNERGGGAAANCDSTKRAGSMAAVADHGT